MLQFFEKLTKVGFLKKNVYFKSCRSLNFDTILFFRYELCVQELTFTVIFYISRILGYEQVRIKYHANGAFPHLYDKIKPEINVVEVGKQYMDPL